MSRGILALESDPLELEELLEHTATLVEKAGHVVVVDGGVGLARDEEWAWRNVVGRPLEVVELEQAIQLNSLVDEGLVDDERNVATRLERVEHLATT